MSESKKEEKNIGLRIVYILNITTYVSVVQTPEYVQKNYKDKIYKCANECGIVRLIELTKKTIKYDVDNSFCVRTMK